MPSAVETVRMLQDTLKIGDNLYSVPSRSEKGKIYVVDMMIGRCECYIGCNGAPCAHQFILWSQYKVSSVNFLPRFNIVDRQKFAFLAMGTALDISYYESLHQPVLMNEHLQDDHEKASSA